MNLSDNPDSPEKSGQENGGDAFPRPPSSRDASVPDVLCEENARLRRELTIVKAQLMIAETRLEVSEAPRSGHSSSKQAADEEAQALPQGQDSARDFAQHIEKYEETIDLLEAEKKKLQAQWTRSANMLLEAVKRAQKAEEKLAALRKPP
ncbi:MAG: hypothetical protein LBD67_01805 [Candidatus Accumulibacter sp.]|jgi:uncharacterized protein YukE|nr:hypothetical protein [Accumulibacter sp.]